MYGDGTGNVARPIGPLQSTECPLIQGRALALDSDTEAARFTLLESEGGGSDGDRKAQRLADRGSVCGGLAEVGYAPHNSVAADETAGPDRGQIERLGGRSSGPLRRGSRSLPA